MSDLETQTDCYETLLSDICVQTNDPEPATVKIDCKRIADDCGIDFGIDFGIDTSSQTDAEPVLPHIRCNSCKENVELIDELVELLGVIEKNVVYTKSLECQRDIQELVQRLEIIEKHVI